MKSRLAAHNAGTAAKYTRARRPVELIYFEEFETKQEAMSREYHIKRMSRLEKLELIKGSEKKMKRPAIALFEMEYVYSFITGL